MSRCHILALFVTLCTSQATAAPLRAVSFQLGLSGEINEVHHDPTGLVSRSYTDALSNTSTGLALAEHGVLKAAATADGVALSRVSAFMADQLTISAVGLGGSQGMAFVSLAYFWSVETGFGGYAAAELQLSFGGSTVNVFESWVSNPPSPLEHSFEGRFTPAGGATSAIAPGA